MKAGFVLGKDGNRYDPLAHATRAEALTLHEGAFVLKAAPAHIHWVCEYASKTPCLVVFVDYRLAPKYAFPFGVEDCYAAFEWVCNHADALGIDKSRIAIGGDSAGGALAAAVTLMARDRQAPPICYQMLLYPVTDARQTTESITQRLYEELSSRKNESSREHLFDDPRV